MAVVRESGDGLCVSSPISRKLHVFWAVERLTIGVSGEPDLEDHGKTRFEITVFRFGCCFPVSAHAQIVLPAQQR